MWGRAIKLLDEAHQVAPARVVLAWKQGLIFSHAAGEAGPDTVFDLASLTKPLATSLLLLTSTLPWQTTLADIWPDTPLDKAAITIRQLLTHSSGLPAYCPYYRILLQHPVEKRAALCQELIFKQPLEYASGSRALYSDLGFLLLGFILEKQGNKPLDKMFQEITARLKISSGLGYRPLDGQLTDVSNIAVCGSMPELRRFRIQGQVEDENAYALNGVAGHAGLFGRAATVRDLLQKAFGAGQAGNLYAVERWQMLSSRDHGAPASTRTAGFDTPEENAVSSAGKGFPQGLVGHLGFTGVSFWYQPLKDMGIVLLTNRVALGRDNWNIREFRFQLHSLLWPLLRAA